MTNGSHRPASTLGKTLKTKNKERVPPGIAITSPQQLKMVVTIVTRVCGVRKRKTGSVTQLMRDTNANLMVLGDNRRKAKHKADMKQKAINKGVQHNINMTKNLATTPADLNANLELLGHAVGTSLA